MSLIAEKNKQNSKASPPLGPRIEALPQMSMMGGRLVSIPDSGINYISKGYNINDIVYSIITLILDKVRVAPWAVYQVKDESSLKAYHAIQRKKDITAEDFRKAKDLSLKAFEPVRNPGKIGDLLQNPNPNAAASESFNDFVANGCGYKLLTGNKLIWADMLDAGANKGLPNSLHIMPSQFIQLLIKSGFPGRVLGYEMSLIALTDKLGFTTEEVYHEKYMNYNWGVNGEQFWGMAPLKAALRRTNRNNSALDASTAKLQNGGVEAIVYVDDDRIPAKDALGQAAKTKTALINEYTGPNNWGKIISVPYKTGVANLGLSPVELDILVSEKHDLRFFCNVYGAPSQLLNDPENKIYNNSKEGEKALTNRCALPLLTSFRDGFNGKLHKDWGWKDKKGWFIDFDMTVFSELQQDIKEMMEWLDKLIARGFPLNRALDLLNIEKIDEAVFDEPWITPAMGMPLSEWSMNDIDSTLTEGDEA